MAIKPLKRTATVRKDGQAKGSSSMTNHTRLRLEDSEGHYLGLFDASNVFVASLSASLRTLDL